VGRRTRADGERSREAVLAAAAALATTEGLQRLSLARVATEAGMSKSGVFGLFGSKEELQLETIAWARRAFVDEVITPTLRIPAGVAQLRALAERFLDHLQSRQWPHGCFFASVAADVGGHPGPLRDQVIASQREWTGLLAANAKVALASGELAETTTPGQLAAELSAMLTGADIAYLLHGDTTALDRIRTALARRLPVEEWQVKRQPG